jgi:acetyl esterase/lipase
MRASLVTVAVLGGLAALTSPPQAGAQGYSSSIAAPYRVTANVTYMTAGAWEAKLDVYARTDTVGANPTLIFFHGGDTVSGSKDMATLFLLSYLEWGWNVVNVEHRLPGTTLAPAAAQNAACALQWVSDNAKQYGFDPDRLVVSGTSSGGWFALTTAFARRDESAPVPCPWLKPTPVRAKVAAVVNWYGVADLVDVLDGPNTKTYASGWVRGLVNPIETARSVSPLTFIRPGLPPVISIHGDADPTVPYSHSVRLHQALRAAKVPELLVTIPGGQHGGFPRNANANAFSKVKAFLADHGLTAGP